MTGASFGQEVVQPRQPPGSVDNHADRPILQDRQGFWCGDRGDTLPVCAVCVFMSVRSAASQEPQVGVVPADPLEGKDHLVPCVVGHAARADHEHRLGLVASIDLERHSLNPGGQELDGPVASLRQTARDQWVESEQFQVQPVAACRQVSALGRGKMRGLIFRDEIGGPSRPVPEAVCLESRGEVGSQQEITARDLATDLHAISRLVSELTTDRRPGFLVLKPRASLGI